MTPQKLEPSCDNLGNIPPGVRKHPAERRDKILDAATDLFAASGYRMTDVQDIADRVIWLSLIERLFRQGILRQFSHETILDVLGDLMYGGIMARHGTASSAFLTKRCDEMLSIVLHGVLSKDVLPILGRPMQAFCLGIERYAAQSDKRVAL